MRGRAHINNNLLLALRRVEPAISGKVVYGVIAYRLGVCERVYTTIWKLMVYQK